MYIFQLASQHAEWLATRQSVTATNIANANTPGYKSEDVSPFSTLLEQTQLGMTSTDPNHILASLSNLDGIERRRESTWDVLRSGNNVTPEIELLKVGENGRMQALDTGLVKVFQRMFLSSLKV